MAWDPPTNEELADHLLRIADRLEQGSSNPHRVRAYRRAAGTLRSVPQEVAELLRDGGAEALQELPGVGPAIGGVLEEAIRSGSSGMLRDPGAEPSPAQLFSDVPGVDRELAEAIVRKLGITRVAELAEAARDGRLEELPEADPGTIERIRRVLAGAGRRGR